MFSVNFQSRTPVYKQLYDNIVRLVSLGVLTADSKLPPVRNLATELGVNPNTVQKAYKMLENDGYIITSVGRGSFVSTKLDIEAKKIEARNALKKSLNYAVSCGVTKDEVKEILDTIIPGGGQND